MAELVLKLRVAGDREVDAALAKLGQAAQEAGVKLQPLKDPAIERQSRQATSALSGLSRTLAGTAALLSVVSRGNKNLQDTFEKVTVALAIGSTALSVYSNVTQLATVKAVGLTAAARAMWAALLGPVGVLVALSAAALGLGLALGALIIKKRETTQKTDELAQSFRGAEERTKAFRASLDKLTRTVKELGVSVDTQVFVEWTNLALAAADSTKRFGLQLEGLLGQTAVFGIVTPESIKKVEAATREAAEKAKKLREEAKRAAEKQFQDEASVIVAFNVWQRQQWEAAAQARTAAWLKSSDEIQDLLDALREAQRESAMDTARFWTKQTTDALEAIREAQRESAVDTARFWTKQTTDALEAIRTAQAESLNDTRKFWEAKAAAAAAAVESARQAWINAVADIVVRAKSLAEVMEGIWEFIKQTIIRKMAEALADKVWDWLRGFSLSRILPFPFNIVAGFFGLQEGGIVTRPTVAALAEGGRPEAVIPLDRMGSMVGREVHVHIHGAAFLGSQEDARKWFQATLGPVLRQEFAR